MIMIIIMFLYPFPLPKASELLLIIKRVQEWSHRETHNQVMHHFPHHRMPVYVGVHISPVPRLLSRVPSADDKKYCTAGSMFTS